RVSKANEDLPEPDRPVITISLSRGRVRSMFFRLWVRAPRIRILSKAASRGGRRNRQVYGKGARADKSADGWPRGFSFSLQPPALLSKRRCGIYAPVPPMPWLLESPPVHSSETPRCRTPTASA